ncbi:probable Sphingosine N-acyltransferase LAG1 [Saccharomycodes ludwigii]|uniref:Probable Sphingosine N-acyltransferase LAG1 n=1 Tax=Saccharomycodes ludwigii TaxID=36035 RepID=A0A376B884_9ASCO|nr:hypothetical protein SCDLUD_004105 [Saccharomycodes ludwigii]KAH3899812.1 hypothetical protein SCDLUD_004105 [Saccharomycodes ludwigii]SSD60913.1 probable Sphingosine N-acyltransferase LAG1 [Saccharomycodes ludwigii]
MKKEEIKSFLTSPTKRGGRGRRSSSVGNINIGDNGPSIGTLTASKESRMASEKRIRALSEAKTNDRDLLKILFLSYREISYRYSWFTPMILLIIVYGAYLSSGNFTESNFLHMFVGVSYQIPGTNMYAKGIKDLCFVFYYMIFFSFFRDFCMDVFLRPIAYKLGVRQPSKVKRMMEQCYSLIYYGISGPLGLYIMYNSDLWLFSTKTMYKTYPDLNNEYLYKIFYLGQAAFWAQQACVLTFQLEKPRKDFKELVFHHVVTLLLIWSSYVFHFSKMGLAVYITMDVSDFFLSLSKVLNYLNSVYTPIFYIFFVISWIYLRHIINLKILWSVLTEFRTEGNYVLNFATQQYKCWISLPIVFALIFALQAVNSYWLFLIFRILYRYVVDGVQKDERSDDESEDELDNIGEEDNDKKAI